MAKMFDFGKNWEEYSLNAADATALADAEISLRSLLDADSLRGKSFLDLGSGSGLFSIAAARLGAGPVLGMDVNPKCIDVAEANTKRFLGDAAPPEFREGSVLDAAAMEKTDRFGIVYAWGSLHHTGRMYDAIRNAAGRVAEGGTFALAIYNRNVTSPVWKGIKWTYNAAPGILRALMVYFFAGVIYAAKFAVTRRNPMEKQRGMKFFYDVVDWVGGYPYEYASRDEIERFVEGLGFRTKKFVPAEVPTGCNEFVFEKTAEKK